MWQHSDIVSYSVCFENTDLMGNGLCRRTSINDAMVFDTERKAKRNPREQFVKTMDFSQCGLQVVMMTLFITMENSAQFYYSVLPVNLQSSSICLYIIMLLYESFTNLFIMSTCFFVLYTQGAFLNAMRRRLERWLSDLR